MISVVHKHLSPFSFLLIKIVRLSILVVKIMAAASNSSAFGTLIMQLVVAISEHRPECNPGLKSGHGVLHLHRNYK